MTVFTKSAFLQIQGGLYEFVKDGAIIVTTIESNKIEVGTDSIRIQIAAMKQGFEVSVSESGVGDTEHYDDFNEAVEHFCELVGSSLSL